MTKDTILKLATILIVGGGLTWYIMRDDSGSVVVDQVEFVCVATGKTYVMPMEDVNIFPMKNPDTGTFTLLPIEEVDGGFFVKERYRSYLSQLAKENQYVDPETYSVKITP
jgi:hypothetical protein